MWLALLKGEGSNGVVWIGWMRRRAEAINCIERIQSIPRFGTMTRESPTFTWERRTRSLVTVGFDALLAGHFPVMHRKLGLWELPLAPITRAHLGDDLGSRGVRGLGSVPTAATGGEQRGNGNEREQEFPHNQIMTSVRTSRQSRC